MHLGMQAFNTINQTQRLTLIKHGLNIIAIQMHILRRNSKMSLYNKKDIWLSMFLGIDRKVIWLLLDPFPIDHSARLLAP